MRLTGNSLDCYKYLEPLYLDYRKLRRMNRSGGRYIKNIKLYCFFFNTELFLSKISRLWLFKVVFIV